MSYSFSLEPESKNSEAIAVINKKSKKFGGEFIYINENGESSSLNNKFELFHDFAKNLKIKQSDYDEILTAIEENDPPENSKLRKIYNDFKEHLKRSNEVKLPFSDIEILPHIGSNEPGKESNECILVNGSKGVGKSTWTGKYAEKWQKLFPKSPIFLLSNKPIEDEPAFNKLKRLIVIPLTKDSLIKIIGEKNIDKLKSKKSKLDDSDDDSEDEQKGYSPHEYFISKTGQSLVIVDDFEGTDIEKYVRIIVNSIISVGRSKRIYCVIISHLLCNGKATKLCLSEVDAYCLFIQGISPYHLKYCLTNYTRLNERQINKICDSNSDWIYIHKKKPSYVIEQHKLWTF